MTIGDVLKAFPVIYVLPIILFGAASLFLFLDKFDD